MPSRPPRRGARVIPVELPGGTDVRVYAGARVADALQELTEDMTLYHGVRLAQVAKAIYEQGLRDGRRQVFEEFDKVKELPALTHRNPGRPRKRVSPKGTARKARKATRKRSN